MGWTKEDSRALKKARDEGDVSAMLRIMYRATEGREPMTPERFYFWCVAFSHRWLDALPDDTLVDLMVDRGFTGVHWIRGGRSGGHKGAKPSPAVRKLLDAEIRLK